MALTPSTARGYIGGGIIYFKPDKESNFLEIGSTDTLEFNKSITELELFDYSTGKKAIESVSRLEKLEATFVARRIDLSMVKYGFQGKEGTKTYANGATEYDDATNSGGTTYKTVEIGAVNGFKGTFLFKGVNTAPGATEQYDIEAKDATLLSTDNISLIGDEFIGIPLKMVFDLNQLPTIYQRTPS